MISGLIRVGHGYDAHRFKAGDAIVLGGVRIAHERGLAAHSDGDVLIHALCDALLGALGLGDIGVHFPDHLSEHEGRDSREFLREVATLLQAKGWQVVNVDMTVIAQAPRLAPHIPLMRTHLSQDLRIAEDCVSIKATTTEGMGFAGRGEGIACQAVALVQTLP